MFLFLREDNRQRLLDTIYLMRAIFLICAMCFLFELREIQGDCHTSAS